MTEVQSESGGYWAKHLLFAMLVIAPVAATVRDLMVLDYAGWGRIVARIIIFTLFAYGVWRHWRWVRRILTLLLLFTAVAGTYVLIVNPEMRGGMSYSVIAYSCVALVMLYASRKADSVEQRAFGRGQAEEVVS